jgi:acetyl esterase/lipase
MSVQQLLALPQPPADHREPYGDAPQQFGELSLPAAEAAARPPHPVVLLVHGGCWRARWGLDHARSLAAALAREGFAVWSLEYRRLGDPGGGWPGTFADVGRGADHLRRLAERYPLDLGRVVAVGHSAGGHLVLWLAGRGRLPADSPLRVPEPLPLAGVVGLAPIADLAAAAAAQVCGDAIPELLGGAPGELPAIVRQASPRSLLPLGVPSRLIVGERDSIVPAALVADYAAAALQAGDDTGAEIVPSVGHFELVDPGSLAWPAVRDAVRALARRAPGP